MQSAGAFQFCRRRPPLPRAFSWPGESQAVLPPPARAHNSSGQPTKSPQHCSPPAPRSGSQRGAPQHNSPLARPTTAPPTTAAADRCRPLQVLPRKERRSFPQAQRPLRPDRTRPQGRGHVGAPGRAQPGRLQEQLSPARRGARRRRRRLVGGALSRRVSVLHVRVADPHVHALDGAERLLWQLHFARLAVLLQLLGG